MSQIILTDHLYRNAIMDEVHARPVDIVPDQCRIRRLVFVMPNEAGFLGGILDRFADFCLTAGFSVPHPSSRQHFFEVGPRHVTWEFHTEFITITWRSGLDDRDALPTGIGLDIIDGANLIGAMRIDVLGENVIPDRLLSGFNLPSLCLSDIDYTLAQVATDFLPDGDQFIRFELAAGRLSRLRRSIIVRRLLEVESYRIMALIGLPLARAMTPELRQIELQVGMLIESLSEATSPPSVQGAMDKLHTLSMQTGKLSERLGYRFAAGRAYGDILQTRLDGLRERGTAHGSTLAHFVGNRVNPALATCEAMAKRLAVVSDKIERSIELLNVRIGVAMQIQNTTVLDNIAKTAKSQFLLQRTVEGLSTIAISYYTLGLLGYAFGSILEHLDWSKATALSIAAPIVVIGVWLIGRAVRRAHAP